MMMMMTNSKCYTQQSIPIHQIFSQLKLIYSGHAEVLWWLFLALFNEAFSTDTYIATIDSHVPDELETASQNGYGLFLDNIPRCADHFSASSRDKLSASLLNKHSWLSHKRRQTTATKFWTVLGMQMVILTSCDKRYRKELQELLLNMDRTHSWALALIMLTDLCYKEWIR
jgi:hypothetical protein